MAILAQKINLYSNAVNNTGLANIYTTQAEMIPNKPNLPVTAGGINGFVQLDDIGAVNGTRGRVSRNSDGKTYQICNQAVVPYGEKAYTAPGTYTFTVPAGISKVKVACVGGGTGRGVSAKGKTSSFGSYLSASGHYYYGSNSAESIGYKLSFTGAKESQPCTGYGHGILANPNTDNPYSYCGYFAANMITVSQNQSIPCVVGAGGGFAGEYGGNGFVYIAWGGDIK